MVSNMPWINVDTRKGGARHLDMKLNWCISQAWLILHTLSSPLSCLCLISTELLVSGRFVGFWRWYRQWWWRRVLCNGWNAHVISCQWISAFSSQWSWGVIFANMELLLESPTDAGFWIPDKFWFFTGVLFSGNCATPELMLLMRSLDN